MDMEASCWSNVHPNYLFFSLSLYQTKKQLALSKYALFSLVKWLIDFASFILSHTQLKRSSSTVWFDDRTISLGIKMPYFNKLSAYTLVYHFFLADSASVSYHLHSNSVGISLSLVKCVRKQAYSFVGDAMMLKKWKELWAKKNCVISSHRDFINVFVPSLLPFPSSHFYCYHFKLVKPLCFFFFLSLLQKM